MKIYGWIVFYIGIALGIAIIIFAFTGSMPPGLILRGLIVVPFGIWWGLRTVRRAEREEAQKRLKKNLEIVLDGFELTRKE